MELPVFCFGQEGNGVSSAVNNICAGSMSYSLEGCIGMCVAVRYSLDNKPCGHSALRLFVNGEGN
jgi:hypothetical protein